MDILFLNILTGDVRPFLTSDYNEVYPAVSPDGRWIAYTSDSSGSYEVYVQPFPGGGEVVSISSGGGEQPFWSKGGDRLYYRNGDRVMVADVITGSEFSTSRPDVLIQGSYSQVSGISFNLHPDGERFLFLRAVGGDTQPAAPHLIFNFDEELERLVPVEGG